ncbi:MAG: carboxymuconolactone decarboxylase family protein [Candidatus Dormibacteria bacterium]
MRVNYQELPGAMEAMQQLSQVSHSAGIEPELLELIKVRASQINGCAFCLDMHSKDALARGETTQRLLGVAAWEEAPYYSERERSALRWCECLTLLPKLRAPEEVFSQLQRNFTEKEILALTMEIVAINGWNRLAVGFEAPVGTYSSPLAKEPAAVAGSG